MQVGVFRHQGFAMKFCRSLLVLLAVIFPGTLLYSDDQLGILEFDKNLQWDRQAVGRFKFSPDGKLLAATNLDWFGTRRPGKIRVWTVETGKEFVDFDLPNTGLLSIDFSPNGQSLFSGSLEGIVRVHDLRSFKTEVTPFTGGQEILLSPDGRTLALSAGQTVSLVDLTTKKVVAAKPLQDAHDIVPCHMAFSPVLNLIAIARKDKKSDPLYEVGLHELQRLNPVSLLQDDSAFVTALNYSHDGSLLATGGDDGTVVVWDVKAAKKKTKINTAQNGDDKRIYQVAFSPDGKLLAVGGTERAQIFTVDPFKEVSRLEGKGVFFMEFSPNGRLVLVSNLIDRDRHNTNLWKVRKPREN